MCDTVDDLHSCVVIDINGQWGIGSDERLEHLLHSRFELVAIVGDRLQLMCRPPEENVLLAVFGLEKFGEQGSTIDIVDDRVEGECPFIWCCSQAGRGRWG